MKFGYFYCRHCVRVLSTEFVVQLCRVYLALHIFDCVKVFWGALEVLSSYSVESCYFAYAIVEVRSGGGGAGLEMTRFMITDCFFAN